MDKKNVESENNLPKRKKFWLCSLIMLVLFSLTDHILYAADLPIETIETKMLAGPPSNWKLHGTWSMKPVLSCKPSAENDAYLRRGVVGDGHITVELSPVTEVPGMTYGIILSVPGSNIKLEKRKTPEGTFVFMILKQGGKDLGEKKLPASVGKTDLILERKGDIFNGWVKGSDGRYQQIGGVTWPDLDALMVLGVFAQTAGEEGRVKIVSLKVGGAKPDPVAVKILFNNKADHVGNVNNGKANIVYNDGRRYTGGFREGKKNGQGVMVYTSGFRYEGEFKDNKPSGGLCIGPDSKKKQCYMNEARKWVYK
jgi:hypothetical protein